MEIKPTKLSFLENYAEKLREKYANVLDYLEQQIIFGEFIKLEKYITKRVNGDFSNILKEFLVDYENS